MERFMMNGVRWGIIFVNPDNPVLIDRTGKRTVACTDPTTKRIYVSNEIDESQYLTVILHELAHCAMVSYGMLAYIHEMVKPEYWIEAEEFICNFIADYGIEIITTANNVR